MTKNTIIKIEGKQPGKTLAIFAGVHGDEKVGIVALDHLSTNLTLLKGMVYLVYANPYALESGVRQIESNLNRCFRDDLIPKNAEEERAVELMKLLESCDALLDIHAFQDEVGEAFIIANELGFSVAQSIDLKIVTTGWEKIHPGSTEAYMQSKGKIGLCIECGPQNASDKYIPVALASIMSFLRYFSLVPSTGTDSSIDKKYFTIARSIMKKTDSFTLSKNYTNFEKLKPGKVFAKDGAETYVARENEIILFPRPMRDIGAEMCIIATYGK